MRAPASSNLFFDYQEIFDIRFLVLPKLAEISVTCVTINCLAVRIVLPLTAIFSPLLSTSHGRLKRTDQV